MTLHELIQDLFIMALAILGAMTARNLRKHIIK